MSWKSRIAVDVGGTFTDVVEYNLANQKLRFDKVPTTTGSPSDGVLSAIAITGTAVSDISVFTHGTTLGLNALLTRTGATTAVIGTLGFRDVFLLGRGDRATNYDLKYAPPKSLLERKDTFEIAERMLFDGSVKQPLDIDAARALARTLRERGYDAVAIAFLHSYANPEHEIQMRELVLEEAPEISVTLSHELFREYREYERTSTAVLDAYVKPVTRFYLEQLQSALDTSGFAGRFFMTRSAGGAITATAAREQPVNLILSGPAGGVVGAAAFSTLFGYSNMITIDMGGTSLDASMILDGEPLVHQGASVEHFPLATPSLHIHTVGAGGGSIVWLDPAGVLQVGPSSAGAIPGPACYGRGGTVPTFTDAAMAVGYLGTDAPLGGRLRLDDTLTTRALDPIAAQLGLTIQGVARGVIRILTAKAVGAVRTITIEVGRDPKDFVLLAFGGGGGLVALDIARELGIATVIVPPGQGAFSAFGMLMADIQHDFSRTEVTPLAAINALWLAETFAPLQAEAEQTLAREGFAPGDRRFKWAADLRYMGQEHSVTVSVDQTDSAAADNLAKGFQRLHAERYGHTMDDAIELTTIRLRATGLLEKPVLSELAKRVGAGPEPEGRRPVFLSEHEPAIDYAIYRREDLLYADEIIGPSIIIEQTATTVIHAADRLRVGRHGELVITLNAAGGSDDQ